ncbi:E3 ubiquitin/ISG15 ligase TRIM25-like isoform X3 [Erpetoichthys calabaricus]|uniref:E3 ubiquitin/ISG15 ligase TRIM25-like isoform X3 n=1 Tax=Erpetoichthys calabaricus TaxID=27687 RepID=UPI0022345D71|nr:E3 ubiquitin/ISG15 ligase TRIM25-like isoform X3 [Erpetoichthys calabaricus]
MAEAHLLISEEEFTCSVCLDTLTDPVSTPCGHSFCLKCLKGFWDHSQVCICPQCRRTYVPRPELQRNTLLNEVIKKLKKNSLDSPPLSQNYVRPGDVQCDACTERKFRAVKSCLTCMASFCQVHLQPHYEGAAWKDHKLTDPGGNLKDKLCAKHQKGLEVFCQTNNLCICTICVATEHRGHHIVELKTAREEKQNELGRTLSEIQNRIGVREKKVEETRKVVEQIKVSAKREVKESEKSFIALIRCIEETCKKVTEKINKQKKQEMKKAEDLMLCLEKEIKELKSKEAALKELLQMDDNIHFLQDGELLFSACSLLHL